MFRVESLLFVTAIHVWIHHANCVPEKIAEFNISDVKSTSFNINFTPVSDAVTYYVTLNKRHSYSTRSYFVDNSGRTIYDLDSDTIYIVSIRGVDSAGNNGNDSISKQIHTHPGIPTIETTTHFPNSAFVFFNLKNYARVTRWMIEYKEHGSTTTHYVTTDSGKYFAHWLPSLTPDTTYEIRARALQIYGTTNLTDSEVNFSDWKNFATESLSIFGRVVITDLPYADNDAIKNTALAKLTLAYTNISHNGITIISTGDSGGNTLVHYQVKVKEKALPSTTNTYILSGTESGFNNSYINNGDVAVLKPYLETTVYNSTGASYELSYDQNMNCSNQSAELYMTIAKENGSTNDFQLKLNHEEGLHFVKTLIIGSDGDIVVDSSVLGTLSLNTIVGHNPKFLVKDCLVGQPTVLLYTQYLNAETPESTELADPFFFTTAKDLSILRQNETKYTTSNDGSFITLEVPAVDKVVKLEILNGSDTVLAMLSIEDLDGSDTWKITISPLENNTQYTLYHQLTFLEQDGKTITQNGDRYTLTTDSNQCSTCSNNSLCSSIIPETSVTCVCEDQYTEDPCTRKQYCDSSPCVIAASCQEKSIILYNKTPYFCQCNSGFSGNETFCTTTAETNTTTDEPNTTIAEPKTTAAKPNTTTAEPSTTTAEPNTTTAEPSTTTAEPNTTTAVKTTTSTSGPTEGTAESTSESTSPEPATTAGEPTTTTAASPVEPIATTAELNTTTAEPSTTTAQPSTTAAELNTTTVEPNTTTAKPNTSTAEPNTTTAIETNTSTSGPTEGTAESTSPEPSTTTAEPNTTTAVETTTSTSGPTEGTAESTSHEPATTAGKPTTTTAAATVEPNTTTAKPNTSTTEPNSTTAIETTTSTSGPTEGTAESNSPEPATTAGEPTNTTASATVDSNTTTAGPTSTAIESTTTIAETTTSTECFFESSEDNDFTPTFSEVTMVSLQADWIDLPDINSYTVSLQCTDCENKATVTKITAESEISFTSLQAGSKYEVCVTAVLCFAGDRIPISECSSTPSLPAAVTDVIITVEQTSVVLMWEEVPGAELYIITIVLDGFRRKRSLIRPTEPTAKPPYKKTGLAKDTRYIFSLSASNTAGLSDRFNGNFTTANIDPTYPPESTPTHLGSTETNASTITTTTAMQSSISPVEPTVETLPASMGNETSSAAMTSIGSSTTIVSESSTTGSPINTITETTTIQSYVRTKITNPTVETAAQSTTQTEQSSNNPTPDTLHEPRNPTKLPSSLTEIFTSNANTTQSLPETPGVPWWLIPIIVSVIVSACVVIGIIIYKYRSKKEWTRILSKSD